MEKGERRLKSLSLRDFGARPVLLVYTARDAWPRRGVPCMVAAATNPVTVQRYAGNAHGVDLLWSEGETLLPLILDWLAAPGVPGPVEFVNCTIQGACAPRLISPYLKTGALRRILVNNP